MMKVISTPLVSLLFVGNAMAQLQGYSVGQTVNDFTVTDTQGHTHNLYSITASGKHVVLDFFFDTCPPCQQTQPYLNQLHETYGCNGADLFVISINNGTDDNAAVDAFEATYGGSYTHSPVVGIEGGCAAVDADFNPVAYPTYCLIGPDNKLKNEDIWPIASMSSFVSAFPAGSDIQTAQCALVSIEEHRATARLSIFPMPTNGPVSVDMTVPTPGELRLELLDPLGRLVYQESLGKRPAGQIRHSMDLAPIGNGNYSLRLTMDGVPTSVRPVMIVR